MVSMPVGLRALSVVALLGLLGGCSASKGKVTLEGDTDAGRTLFAQSFNKAYISKSHDGEYDVILMQDPQVSKNAAKGGNRPLQPLAAASLRQIVHIHVFWRGDGGSVARDGVVTNSAIDWYVIAHEASDRPEVLRYEGAGYVLLNPGRNGTSVEIRDGSMKKTESHGDLRDPLGPARLTGTVKAQQNSQFVRDTLEDLKSQTATAKTAVTLR
jgi:hypothetical protein